jgi:hypothetical protein
MRGVSFQLKIGSQCPRAASAPRFDPPESRTRAHRRGCPRNEEKPAGNLQAGAEAPEVDMIE